MIKVTNLKKSFNDFLAIDDTTVTFDNGKIYGIIGTNGAGKSTFLRIISGVYNCNSGSVLYDDAPVFDNAIVKQNICFIPDELYFENGANLATMAKRYKMMYPSFDTDVFNKLIIAFKLDSKKILTTFSKGMRRLAAIILAISSNANYLLFDEAYDGLDPFVKTKVKELLYEKISKHNATVIITSHSIVEMEGLCDDFLLFNDKKLILNGDINELKSTTYKVSLAFNKPTDRTDLAQLDILEYKNDSKLINLIVKGTYDDIQTAIDALEPVYSKITPMSLLEIIEMTVNNTEVE